MGQAAGTGVHGVVGDNPLEGRAAWGVPAATKAAGMPPKMEGRRGGGAVAPIMTEPQDCGLGLSGTERRSGRPNDSP